MDLKNLRIDDCAFLCGSGISLPSGVPTVKEFYNAWNINLRYGYKSILSDELVEKINDILETAFNPDVHNRYQNRLRFEALVEIFYNYACDKNFNCLNPIKEANKPNDYHKWLIKASLDGSKIITTNFDSLLETAFLEMTDHEVKSKSLATLVNDIDFEHWKTYSSNKLEIFKLHGSFFSYSNNKFQHSTQSIESTISRIGSDGFLSLSHPKRKVFSKILQDKHLIVIGYGGGDSLDIIENMCEVESDKMIIWVVFDSNDCRQDKFGNIIFEPIEETQCSTIDSLLNRLKCVRKSERIFKIKGNPYHALKLLFPESEAIPPTNNEAKINTITLFEDRPLTLAFCASLILAYLGYLEYSVAIWKQLYSIKIFSDIKESKNIKFYSLLGLIDHHIAFSKQHHDRVVFIRSLIKKFEKTFPEEIFILNSIKAKLAMRNNNMQSAKRIMFNNSSYYLNESKRLISAKAIQMNNQLAILVTKLSITFDHFVYKEANILLKKAEAEWKNIGYLPRLYEVWFNAMSLGIIANDNTVMKHYRDKIFDLNIKLELYNSNTQLLWGIAKNYKAQGNYEKADLYYRKTIQQLSEGDYVIQYYQCLCDVGQMWLDYSEVAINKVTALDRSKVYFEEASECSKEYSKCFDIFEAVN